MEKIAIFDIDGTVFRSSLLIKLVEGLIDAKLFPKEVAVHYKDPFIRWTNREGTYDDYIQAVVAVYLNNIQGILYDDFLRVAEGVVAEEQKKVYRYSRDLIEQLKHDGYYLVAISQSPKMILEGFCKGIGFDKVYGRMYEIGPQKRFTGEMMDVHLIANKANIVHRLKERHGADLTDSVGVGDTEDDIPFLELVSQPICFNPNRRLYDHAKKYDWPVVVERKDVIYEL